MSSQPRAAVFEALHATGAGRYPGARYGGWKQSGIGREESLDELLS
ncbi:MAG TPA: hypothetical protein VN970_10610 [Thermoanaerobaculia bacterium]|nr:hypothetical protein [Thermoanaerobaculia bacterium]